MSNKVMLTGLDGSNPLAFLAALGVLRVLDEAKSDTEMEPPRLTWEDTGRWRPVIYGRESLEEVIDAILTDIRSWAAEPALNLAYEKGGGPADASDANATRDLKPTPSVMRMFLEQVARRAAEGQRRSADAAAAFGTEIVQDNKGNTKPTALHFTAGQQQFLKMAVQLQQEVGRKELTEALVGPWTGASKLPSLSWDATVSRLYAHRATDPSGEKRGSVPGADWLAFLGLSFFPVAARGGRLETTGVVGRWKDAEFTWPIWTPPATARTVRSLLAWSDLCEDVASERPDPRRPARLRARGIAVLFRSAITRSDQGGYGGFTPARVV